MKKLINMAFLYGFLGLISGAFYREFTKFMGYRGTTTLSVLHVHLLVLGFTLFLILALFAGRSDLTSDKMFKRFYSIYSV
ncbi:MAG: DUF2871 family protein, partial [Bacillota bacterium]|nr:DUF2871 family protein [Bacillota bacterium]